MATEIVAVRMERTYGATHEHIAYVKTLDGTVLERAVVVQRINSGWESFCTRWGGVTARVFVRECPRCWANDYITTTPDGTVNNNLLSLPRF